MDNQLVEMKNWGCDVENALERTLNNEEYLLRYMKKAVHDKSIALLGKALEDKDCTNAFEAAHDLKGVTGTVGLTPIYNIVVRIVEPLRVNDMTGMDELYSELLQSIAKAKEILGDN